jgi:Transposase
LRTSAAKAGISPATYFNWKKKYDGLLPAEMRRLKLLEDENAKLRKVVADLRPCEPELIRVHLVEMLESIVFPRRYIPFANLSPVITHLDKKQAAKMAACCFD